MKDLRELSMNAYFNDQKFIKLRDYILKEKSIYDHLNRCGKAFTKFNISEFKKISTLQISFST